MVEGVKIPQRGPDQSRKAIRVQVPSGSFNACRRRELPRGDTRNRVMTMPGDPSNKGGR